jgi:D-serine deaminase-like pyridoxal phosphate-dependent protein
VISHLPNIFVIGVHAYDGHIRDRDPKSRKVKADKVFRVVNEFRQALENEITHSLKVVLGGSPTFRMHAQREDVQCSPGTFVFWDWGYCHSFPEEPFEYAALILTRVISLIDPHTICLDLGHKSVGAENPLPRVHFLNAPDLEPVSQSEEHLVAKVSGNRVYTIGEVLYGVPVHICPTVALYERAVIIEDNRTAGEWKVLARDRKISL